MGVSGSRIRQYGVARGVVGKSELKANEGITNKALTSRGAVGRWLVHSAVPVNTTVNGDDGLFPCHQLVGPVFVSCDTPSNDPSRDQEVFTWPRVARNGWRAVDGIVPRKLGKGE